MNEQNIKSDQEIIKYLKGLQKIMGFFLIPSEKINKITINKENKNKLNIGEIYI